MEQRPAEVAVEVVLAVWEAEDGRCESCKRAMDKRWARVARIDARGEQTVENLQLLCVDCKAYRPDQLRASKLELGGEVAERVLGKLAPEQVEAATQWLSQQLKRYGVIVSGSRKMRRYWLPGVGTFHIQFAEDGRGLVFKADKLSAQPQVRVKPQERTRGLARPDRSRMPARAPKQAKAAVVSGKQEPVTQ